MYSVTVTHFIDGKNSKNNNLFIKVRYNVYPPVSNKITKLILQKISICQEINNEGITVLDKPIIKRFQRNKDNLLPQLLPGTSFIIYKIRQRKVKSDFDLPLFSYSFTYFLKQTLTPIDDEDLYYQSIELNRELIKKNSHHEFKLIDHMIENANGKVLN
jgi:hypothetical protein